MIKSVNLAHRDHFIRIAFDVSRRSTCLTIQTGAVIVKDELILACGFTDVPKGLPNCQESGCDFASGECIRPLHAEQNAILQAAFYGISLAGGTIYLTQQPCIVCAMSLTNAGIIRLLYAGDNRNDAVLKYLIQSAITVEQIADPD